MSNGFQPYPGIDQRLSDALNQLSKRIYDIEKSVNPSWFNQSVKSTDIVRFGSAKIGTFDDNTEIEADGTIKLNGKATVFNDINTGVNPRNTGAGRPTLATFNGNISEFQFAVNDYADLTPIEFLHGWKEGTPVEIHCHWATGGLNDTTVRGVKWEVEYSWATVNGVFSTPVVASVETSIAANLASLSHKYTSIATFTPTGGLIGSQLAFRIKRIASVTNVAPVANPFLLSIGIHYEIDTIGSRLISSK